MGLGKITGLFACSAGLLVHCYVNVKSMKTGDSFRRRFGTLARCSIMIGKPVFITSGLS